MGFLSDNISVLGCSVLPLAWSYGLHDNFLQKIYASLYCFWNWKTLGDTVMTHTEQVEYTGQIVLKKMVTPRELYKHGNPWSCPVWPEPCTPSDPFKNVSVSSGCYNKIPDRKLTDNSSGSWEVQDQGSGRVSVWWESTSTSWVIDIFLLYPHEVEGQGVPWGLFYKAHSWGLHSYDLLPFKGSSSKYHHTGEKFHHENLGRT